ncbi:MAG: GDYXXLXY domain-containing protein [Azoarcus sp.]|nr:GDYXXLXY domain-containing protein [Azoarcus sp.]
MPKSIDRWIALVAGLAVLATANYTIQKREQLLSDGRVVLLALAPVDPRSLMQGDYMALRFAAADAAFGTGAPARAVHDGHLVLKLDDRGIGSFNRFDDGTPPAPDELRMRYRIRDGKPRFATNAFFFQEGDAARYESARFGEFRVDASGEAILTGLRAENLDALGPSPDSFKGNAAAD